MLETYKSEIEELIKYLKDKDRIIKDYRNLPEDLKKVSEEEYPHKWSKTIERIINESENVIGLSEELKYKIILEKLKCLKDKEKYIRKKFEKLKNMDMSDEFLEINQVTINYRGNKIIAIKLDDDVIVDTLTISLIKIYHMIKDNIEYLRKFEYFFKNFKVVLYYKKDESAIFFRVYLDDMYFVTGKRILIAFEKFERFLDEIITRETSKKKNSIIRQIMKKFSNEVFFENFRDGYNMSNGNNMTVDVRENNILELEKMLGLWKNFVNFVGKKYPHYDLTNDMESNYWLKNKKEIEEIIEKLKNNNENTRNLLKELIIEKISSASGIGLISTFINNTSKINELKEIIIDVKNSNQFKNEWINKTYELIKSEFPQAENLPLRGHLYNVYGELYGKLHIEKEPIMNGCSKRFLRQYLIFDNNDYYSFKQAFKILKQKYKEIVGKLSEFPDEFINLEIDQMFNFFDKVNLYEVNLGSHLDNNVRPGDIVIIKEDSKVVGIGIVEDNNEYRYLWKLDDILNIPLRLEKTIDYILDKKGQIILYGVPGTGKTWCATQYVKNNINIYVELRNNNDWYSFAELFEEILKTQITKIRYEFATFHQSYSYEDFIEGFRPKNDENGNIIYEVEDGIFKKMCILAIYEALKINSPDSINFKTEINDINDINKETYKKN